jgi:hypothetical protein
MPLITPNVNVKFNGTLENAVVLKDAGGFKTVILSDDLSAADLATLTAFVNDHGGAAPMAGPSAGFATAKFPAATVGGTATGLSAVAAATAGVATINVGGAKVGADPSGLSSSVGTAGSQRVNVDPGKVGADATGLFGGTAATAGRQSVSWTGLVGASATGLANDATVYTATITVDGVAKAIAVTGSAAQTFTTLVAEINTDLGASATASIFSATELRVVSATTGALSTVAIVDGTLFTALTGFGAIQTAVPGAALVPATTYTATITVDGVSKPISILGSAALTWTTLLSELNTDLGAAAVATLAGGDLKVESVTFGTLSRVRIVDGTLFAALTGFVGILPPQDGDDTSHTYSALVEVDGVLKSVKFIGTAGATFTDVLTEVNADLGGAAVASIVGGNVAITSATTGVASKVRVYDAGLFAALAGYTGISWVDGVAPTVYTATMTVDGIVKAIAVQGSAAQTFTTLLAEINTDLAGAATAALSGGNVVVTSATTGLSSTVVIVDGSLFKHVAGFAGFVAPVPGAVDLVAAMNATKVGGVSLFDQFQVKVVGAKPAVPAVPAVLPNLPQFTYFDGLVWRYLGDDTAV